MTLVHCDCGLAETDMSKATSQRPDGVWCYHPEKNDIITKICTLSSNSDAFWLEKSGTSTGVSIFWWRDDCTYNKQWRQ